jgi:hypothetical protein
MADKKAYYSKQRKDALADLVDPKSKTKYKQGELHSAKVNKIYSKLPEDRKPVKGSKTGETTRRVDRDFNTAVKAQDAKTRAPKKSKKSSGKGLTYKEPAAPQKAVAKKKVKSA